ncbi:MAG TPA: hypothetical protein VG326_13325 [Tepidisphaeraceae bacterium]|jgi:hypothetical protein|nr:hypothetical protein [Tepidisphaeraceae bacterium]
MTINPRRSPICLPWCLLLFTLAGCGDHRAWTSTDPWFHPPVAEPHDSEPIGGGRIDNVVPDKELEAEEMLAAAPFVELTPQQADAFAGYPLIPHPGARPYLMRGVYLRRRTGVFQVYSLGRGDYLVYHECLGSAPAAMKRQALVVQLDKPPRRVFAFCRMTDQAPAAAD